MIVCKNTANIRGHVQKGVKKTDRSTSAQKKQLGPVQTVRSAAAKQ